MKLDALVLNMYLITKIKTHLTINDFLEILNVGGAFLSYLTYADFRTKHLFNFFLYLCKYVFLIMRFTLKL